MNETEFKPCPFCGSTNISLLDHGAPYGRSAYTRKYSYARCDTCFSQTGYHDTKPKTIEAWNRRVKNEQSD